MAGKRQSAVLAAGKLKIPRCGFPALETRRGRKMSTELKIEFDTGNAAFDDGNGPEECARILRNIADRMRFRGDTDGGIMDSNGNRIGSWSVEFPGGDL